MTTGDSTIRLTGELDLAGVERVRPELDVAVAALSAIDTLVVDVSGLQYIDSLGLGLLVRVRNGCLAVGAAMVIRGMSERGRRLVALSGLASLFVLEEQPTDGRTVFADLPATTPLPAAPDPLFDQMASLVRRVLGVPTALVSLVDTSQQVFPGAVGLPDPWQESRRTPLTHSFCQYVVADGQPLTITDARADPLLAHNLALPDLGVVAYAGMPLTDIDGVVVGSLCAIDAVPREWTETQLANLRDLATACSSELQKRGADQRVAVATERDRIARDLHHRVVGELFLATMALGQARGLTAGRADDLVAQAVDTIDDAITTIRTTIFRS